MFPGLHGAGPGQNLGGATFTVTVNTQQLNQGLQQAQQVAQRAGRAIQHNLQQPTHNAALGFLELSRAIEDAQYGFHAIVNNIPQIALGLGMGAGVAGAASLAAVGIAQLIHHFDDLKDALQSNWLGIPAEQLAEIRRKAEEAAEAFDKLAKTPTKAEEAAAKGLGEVVTEAGAGRMAETIALALSGSGMGEAFQDDERIALRAVENAKPDVKAGVTNRIMARINEANLKRAKEMLGAIAVPGGATGAAAQTLATLIRENPKMFPPGFLGQLERLDPAEQAAQAKLEREGELNAMNQANRLRIKAEDDRRAEQQKALEIEGRDREKAMQRHLLRKRAEGLERQMRRAEAGLTPEQRADWHNKMLGISQPRPSETLTTREYVNRTQSAALSQIPKQQLGHLKEMDKNLKTIKDKIENLGGLR